MFVLVNVNEFAFLSDLATFFAGGVSITNRMSSIEARGGQARTASEPRRNPAKARRGHHRRWTASINRINVIWRSGWMGTKRPWWRPWLRAFRLRPLALARGLKLENRRYHCRWPRSQCPLVLPTREKEGDQDTLSPCSFRFTGSTLSCRFRRVEVGRASDWSPSLSVFAVKEICDIAIATQIVLLISRNVF